MTARTFYALPGPLALTPSQLGRLGRFKLTSRTLATVRIELFTDTGADVADVTNPGDSVAWPLLGVRAVHLSASSYPAHVLLESTELPIDLDCAIQIDERMNVHIVGGSGGGPGLLILPNWNFDNPGRAGYPALSLNDPGHSKSYQIVIRYPSGTVAATYLWGSVSGDSLAGDGSGIDNFGAQGPMWLVDGYTYTIEATVLSAPTAVGYSTGLTTLFDVSANWPAGVSVTQVPVGAASGVPVGVPFLIGSFTAHVP